MIGDLFDSPWKILIVAVRGDALLPGAPRPGGQRHHGGPDRDLFRRQGFGLWALEVSATGEFIGFTGLNPMPAGVPGAGGMEVGWRLARGAWHQGFASEAAAAAAGVAFRGAGLAELWSMTAVRNEPSQAVMRRLGMTLHAHFDHPGVAAGYRSARTSPTACFGRERSPSRLTDWPQGRRTNAR